MHKCKDWRKARVFVCVHVCVPNMEKKTHKMQLFYRGSSGDHHQSIFCIWSLFVLYPQTIPFILKQFNLSKNNNTELNSKGFPGGSAVKNLPAMQETQVQFLGWEDPLEKELATHSSILVWKIPWTEEPGGLKVHGGHKRVRHDLA